MRLSNSQCGSSNFNDFRIVRSLVFDPSKNENVYVYAIHEVAISDAGAPIAWSDKPYQLRSSSFADLMDNWKRLNQCQHKPIIDYITGKIVGDPLVGPPQ